MDPSAHDRTGLERQAGKRNRYRARVAKLGAKKSFGHTTETLLLIEIAHNGDQVADHLWFTRGKWDAGLRMGDIIEFDARSKAYAKGYRGHREDVLEWSNGPEEDHKLANPTAVVVVDHDREYVLAHERDRESAIARANAEADARACERQAKTAEANRKTAQIRQAAATNDWRQRAAEFIAFNGDVRRERTFTGGGVKPPPSGRGYKPPSC